MKSESLKCKKLTYINSAKEFDNSPRILFGLIIKEDSNFLYFKTARREYTISKKRIISIEDTDIDFKEM